MLRLNIKNFDGSDYGYVVLSNMDAVNHYIEQCKAAGSFWTKEVWTRLEDSDPRITENIATRTVVGTEETPEQEEVVDEDGNVISEYRPAAPATTHKEYNLGCYWEIVDLGIEPILKEVRAKRNKLLQECDYTQLPDSPLSEEEKQEWAEYRQQLRDITQLVSADGELEWPNPPEK
jgi:hypothetical protein